jgi:hypothetical protein
VDWEREKTREGKMIDSRLLAGGLPAPTSIIFPMGTRRVLTYQSLKGPRKEIIPSIYLKDPFRRIPKKE